MTEGTIITIQNPATGEEWETTWDAFVSDNDDETVETTRAGLEAEFYAEVGGGAAPTFWLFV